MKEIIAWAVLAILVILGALYASGARADFFQDEWACRADVLRYCPKLYDGKSVISCLQNHRASLTKACSGFLLDRGL